MPRVNRDLQRRMAARRERERRRPADRRYQFAPPSNEPALAPEEPFGDGEPLAEEVAPEAEAEPTPTRATTAVRNRPMRGQVARAAPRPFSDYRDDYRYVIGDLRRILLVVGSLLAVLIVLWLVLPR